MANRRTRSAYYSDDEDRYSDDFVSDEDRKTPNKNTNNDRERSSSRTYFQDRLRGKGRGMAAGGRGRGRGSRKGRGGGRGQNSRNSEPPDLTRRSHDSVTQRVLSASRNKVNEYRNQVAEMTLKMKELAEENKLYKKLQFRQEKALKTFEDKENDLPSILEKHANEVRSLKENNRRLRDKFEKSDRYLRDAEDELERANKKVKKLRELVDEKDLKERDELSRKLTKAEIDMEEKEVKIKELQRHIDILKKNHRHELGIEAARLREMKKQVEDLEESNEKLSTQLKESRRMNAAISRIASLSDREAQLVKTNIYANRAHEEAMESPIRRVKKKTSSLTDLTPRDKAKFYADKKREEFKKQKASLQETPDKYDLLLLKSDQEKKKREKWEQEERDKQKKYEEEERARKSNSSPLKYTEEEPVQEKEFHFSPPPKFSFKSLDDGIEDKERENRIKKEEEDRKWQHRQEEDRRQKEELEEKRKDLERRQEENRRKQMEDQVRKEKEESQRREREETERKYREEIKEKEAQERREQQERDRREKEKFEQERRIEQEKRKLENDPSIQEERKKKDDLLRKLKAMDELGAAGTKPEIDNNTSPIRMNSNSRGGSFGSDRERKDYSFTKPVNNLHNGKPSHEDNGYKVPDKPRNRRVIANNDNEDGGYNPSFGPTRMSSNKPTNSSKPLSIFDDDEPMFKLSDTKPEKKSSNLLENLFGSQAAAKESPKKNKLEENETFFVSNNNKSPAKGKSQSSGNATVTTFPWDASPSKVNGNSTSNFSNETTLFGGGAAMTDNDFTPSGNRVLPRRQRQNFNTISSKPSVLAVDNFEDDIEEVVL